MSDQYRLMIYFAHSTMVLYQRDVISSEEMTPEEFWVANQGLINRVVEEAVNIFQYKLSVEQLNRACYTFLAAKYFPQSVQETEAYKLLA